MKWVTRERPKVDRVACPWLIRRFIDPDAELLYVPREEVLEVADREGAISFDASGARYTHREGKCTFEVLVEDFDLQDLALRRLARIIHGADVAADIAVTAESAGLKAIAEGFPLVYKDDHELLAEALPVYEALYAYCRSQEGKS